MKRTIDIIILVMFMIFIYLIGAFAFGEAVAEPYIIDQRTADKTISYYVLEPIPSSEFEGGLPIPEKYVTEFRNVGVVSEEQLKEANLL